MTTVRRVGDELELDYEDGSEQVAVLAPGCWPTYRKHALTSAKRMDGPFMVETSEGPLLCADGYLAVDARGYPYPIAADEFELIYAPAPAVGPARDLHPSEATMLRFFAYDHLPENLQRVSAPFEQTAAHIISSADPGPETTTALRKLLEAKDCAVRAALLR